MAKKVAKKTSKTAKKAPTKAFFNPRRRVILHDSVISPKKSVSVSSKRVTFRYSAPDASEVLLAACFTKWDEKPKKMKKLKNGTWNARVELKVGETYRYRYIVDGEWTDDPECTERETSPFGTENCLITVT